MFSKDIIVCAMYVGGEGLILPKTYNIFFCQNIVSIAIFMGNSICIFKVEDRIWTYQE